MGEKRGKIEREKKVERERKRVLERELYHLSRFPSDRSDKLRRGKKQSWSPLQELCVGTNFVEFRQTSKGRGFLLLVLFFG